MWADLACSLIRDENQRPMYFVAQVEDVTARHEAEQDLQLHEEITRNMAEGVVLVRTADLEIVYANRKFEEMFGYEPGELIGRPVDVVNTADEAGPRGRGRGDPESAHPRRRLVRAGSQRQEDGTRFWCQANVSNFEHPLHGTVSVAVHTDITAQRRSESELRAAEERFRRAFEDAGTGMAVIGVAGDKDGRFLEVNDELCQITGYPREQLLRMTEAALLHPDDLPSLDEGIRLVMAGQADTHRGEVRLVSASGDTVWASISSSVVRDSDGEPQMRLLADARHLRAQAVRGPAAAPGRPRRADRADQPPAVRGGARARAGRGQALRPRRRRAGARPRQLQVRQRHPSATPRATT